jgi:pimeloyl-ACP methyl ester carboxylesterase
MKARIGDRTLAYESFGGGQPLVLIHAFPLDGRMWASTARSLAGRCRVIVPDMRGFGESELGGGDPSIADMADDVAALLDCLGIERATVGWLVHGRLCFAGLRRSPSRAS